MAEEAAGDEEDEAGGAAQPGVQKPEAGDGHFLEEVADPADEVVRGEEVELGKLG